MAKDFIRIDTTITTATHAQKLKNFRNVLRDAYEQGKEVLAVMEHNQDGTDFTDLEALFGLPTGEGQDVFDMVNGAVGSMEGLFQVADVKDLTETLG